MPSAYKKITLDGKTIQLHRYVYEQTHGPIPDGMLVHHVNEDKLDNRIENLELMTHKQHCRHHNDKHPRVKVCQTCGASYEPHPTKRERSKTCSRDCARALMSTMVGRAKGSAKLDDSKVVEIRQRVAAGEQQKAMCAIFGVSPMTVSAVVNRKTWRHVP